MSKILNFLDIPHKYNIDELSCYEHPIATALNYFDSNICNVYILLSKLYGMYMVDLQTNSRIAVINDLEKQFDIDIKLAKKISWKYLKECIDNNIPLIVGVNLYDIMYSENYLKKDWGHWFLVKGYDENNGTVIILDNVQYNDLGERYSDFRISFDMLMKAHKSFLKKYSDEITGISLSYTEKECQYKNAVKHILDLYLSINVEKSDNYRQINLLRELEKLSKNDSDFASYYVEEFKKKIININKYREVFINELCKSMVNLEYDHDNIVKLKENAAILNELWKMFTLKYSIIVTSKHEKIIEIDEEIKKCEIQIQNQIKEYALYLNGVKKNNSVVKNSEINNITYEIVNDFDGIIKGSDKNIQFSFVKNKIYNWWIEDNAPKVCLVKSNFSKIDSKKELFIRTQMNIKKCDRFTSGEKYQAGFYIKTYEDNNNYMCALNEQEEWSIDKVGYEGKTVFNRDTYNIFVRIVEDMIIFGTYDDKGENILLQQKIINIGDFEVGLICKTWEKWGKLIVGFNNTEVIF